MFFYVTSVCLCRFDSRLLQLEEGRDVEFDEQRKHIHDEYARKVSELEQKLQMLTRERDALKTTLHDAEVEIARRSVKRRTFFLYIKKLTV